MNPFVHFSFLVFALSTGLGWNAVADGENLSSTAKFDVGVILDMNTWLGKISWSCMLMAADDFYEVHSNHTTKLSFHLKDSEDDVVNAGLSAYEFITKVRVRAIIGPQTSSESKFVAELGSKFHVPTISFTSTTPFLSSTTRTPYFIPTAISDSVQAKVIAALIQTFKWREAILLMEDSDFGIGIASHLIDSFQDIDASISHKCMISLPSTISQILQKLGPLKNMQVKVFVVHASYDLVSRIFLAAKEAAMMSEGYAWIRTYGTTDYLHLMDPMAIDAMQGVVSVNPYVAASNRLGEFKAKWKNKFYVKKNTSSLQLDQPGIFGLWAYDAVWSLATAAESVHNTWNQSTPVSEGAKLLDSLLKGASNLGGGVMSGNFYISGSLERVKFEIVNVIGSYKKRVGFWTLAHGISRSLNHKAPLYDILWPGDSMRTPNTLERKGGLKRKTGQKKLRIGIPVQQEFHELVNYEWNPFSSRNGNGFSINVFDMVMASLPYNVDYEYIPYMNGNGRMKGTYDDIIHEVYLQNFDAAVGDISITQNRSFYVDFTVPFSDLGASMLVPLENDAERSAWIFLKPLTAELWVIIGIFFIFTAFVIWFLEHQINEEFSGSLAQQFGNSLYFSFSTMVFAHKDEVKSNLTKIVVSFWLFAVLILTSSYTASLSSMLTVQQLRPTATNVEDLIRSGTSIGYMGDLTSTDKQGIDKSRLKAYYSKEEFNDALSRGSSHGGVSAIIAETPYLKAFLSKYCNNYTMIGPVYKTNGFGFAFSKGSPLVNDISREMTRLSGDIENLFYKSMDECSNNSTVAVKERLAVGSFSGLFLITGLTSAVALLLYISQVMYKQTKASPPLHEPSLR